MYVAVIRTPKNELLVGSAPDHTDDPVTAIQNALSSLFDEPLKAEVYNVPVGGGWCINAELQVAGEGVELVGRSKVQLAETQSDIPNQVVHLSVDII